MSELETTWANPLMVQELANPVSTHRIGPLTIRCLRQGGLSIEYYASGGDGIRLIIFPEEAEPLMSLLIDHCLATRAGRTISREESCRGH